MNCFYRHFACLEQHPPWRYLRRVALETFALSIAVALVGVALGMKERPIKDLPLFLISAVFIAPWLETAVFQWLPIAVCRRFGASRGIQIGVSVAVFAMPHFVAASVTGLSAGLVGGFYFAFTYTAWRRQSALRAYAMTTAHHALYNLLIALTVIVLLMFE